MNHSTHLNRVNKVSLSFAALVAGACATGAAMAAADHETDAHELYSHSATVATNIPRIQMFADAPSGFDPVTAGDADLAAYGFPPRPDPSAEPDHYALWKRAMGAAKIHWHGALKPVTTPKGPSDSELNVETLTPEATTSSPAKPASKNWGGVVLTKALSTWNSGQSFRDIYSEMTVPVGQPPFDSACDAYYARTFAGLNGYVKNSRVQPGAGQGALIGGFQTATFCSSDDTTYVAIFGWEPGYLQGAFPVNPGDVVYTEVSAPGQGIFNSYLFIEDLTTLTYDAYSVPVDYTFIGNSAEWVVERPCCESTGVPYPLVNGISQYFDGGAALDNAGHTLYPGSQASSTQVLTMRDDTGDQVILEVDAGSAGYEGLHGVQLVTTGCAFTGGCTK